MPAERTSTTEPRTRHQWLQHQHRALQTAWLRVKKSQGMEAIHEVRVAARRLRTVLKAWRKEIHPLKYDELRFDLRNVGRLLAPAREADVRRRLTAKLLHPLPEELTQSANRLLARLDQSRADERHALRIRMHSERWNTTLAHIQACIDSDQLLAVPRANENPASDLIRFEKQLRKVHKSCARKRLPTPQLHALRIKGKRTRYVGEALAELSGQDLTASLKLLRQLQDVLGDLHDCLQIREWCRSQRIDPALMVLLETRLDRWQKIQHCRFDALRTAKHEA